MVRAPFTSLLVLVLVAPLACGGEDALWDPLDGDDPEEEPRASTGKADGTSFDACTTSAMLAYLNKSSTTYSVLRGISVGSTAAKNIVAHRDGADGTFGTSDDDLFGSIAELDAVSYVGPTTMGLIAKAVASSCPSVSAEVVFSPQPYASSHLTKIKALIDGAQKSLDIAMYNLSDSATSSALQSAVQRGVKVRFISEDARADAASPTGSKSAALEALGVNVRYVTKIMHHKLVIVDGPRDDTSKAATAKLATGSANWSGGGATRYDENTLFLSGVPELALAYQAEFNLLWEHSKDFAWDTSLPFEKSITLDPSTFPVDADVDSLFTSANFSVGATSTTFKRIVGKEVIAAALVKEIQGAQTSIHVASGHLRSRPVAEALIAAKAAKPSLDIKVYLDGQEYISLSGHTSQLATLKACLAQAGTDAAKIQDCKDTGFLFSYQVDQAGAAVRFKYYAYRWDYSYAKQMHNKYFVFDGKTLYTGSYNLSDNAEHNTFENMVVLRGAAYSSLIQKYESSFSKLWQTDSDGSLLASLKQRVQSSSTIPLVFEAMALTWQQVTDLKALILANCPAVNSTEYRQNPAAHTTCPRSS